MFKKDELKNFVRLKILRQVTTTDCPASGKTMTGYGRNLPTHTMVQTEPDGPLRRVRVACFSNSGSCYVRIKGERVLVEE